MSKTPVRPPVSGCIISHGLVEKQDDDDTRGDGEEEPHAPLAHGQSGSVRGKRDRRDKRQRSHNGNAGYGTMVGAARRTHWQSFGSTARALERSTLPDRPPRTHRTAAS